MTAEQRARDPDAGPDELRRLLPTHLDTVLTNPALALLLLEEPALALDIQRAMLPRAAKQIEELLIGSTFLARQVFALLCAERSSHLAEGPGDTPVILRLVRGEVLALGQSRMTNARLDHEYRLRKAVDERASHPESARDMARESIVAGLVATPVDYAARAASNSAHALSGGATTTDHRRALDEREWQIAALTAIRAGARIEADALFATTRMF